MTEVKHGTISLVSRDDDVYFIRWTANVQRRMARRTSLDNRNRVKTLVHSAVEEVVYTPDDTELLIIDTGSVMIVTKSKDRPEMPAWCILLRDLHLARLHSGPLPPNEHNCVFCVTPRDIDFPKTPTLGPRSILHRCRECAFAWHLECAACISEDPHFHMEDTCPMCVT